VSGLPSSAKRGSSMAAPRVKTSAIGPPTASARSASCERVSWKMPAARRMPSRSGPYGSAVTERTVSTVPSSPAASSPSRRAMPGSNRRWKPIWKGVPVARRVVRTRATSSQLRRERLLAEDRLAGPGGRLDDARVGLRGRDDDDRVHVVAVGLRGVAAGARAGRPGRDPLGRGEVLVDDHDQSPAEERRQRPTVEPPHQPRADQREPDHLHVVLRRGPARGRGGHV
jgi:hypothetical protein